MITSTTQAAVAALVAAVQTDLGTQAVSNINVNANRLDDGSYAVGISAAVPATGTSPAANGQISINYIMPKAS